MIWQGCFILVAALFLGTSRVHCAAVDEEAEYDYFVSGDGYYSWDEGGNKTDVQNQTTTNHTVPHHLCRDIHGCVRATDYILTAMNSSLDPCEDFYQYACGGMPYNHNISSTETGYNRFTAASHRIGHQLQNILMESPHVHASFAHYKARMYFKSCLNEEGIAMNGIEELRKMVVDLGGFPLHKNDKVALDWTLDSLISKFSRYSSSALFVPSVARDLVESNKYIISLKQSALGLGAGTRNFYLAADAPNNPILAKYEQLLRSYAIAIFGSRKFISRKNIQDVVLFEQRLAYIQLPAAETQNATAIYHKVNISWMDSNINFINWRNYFRKLFDPVQIDVDSDEQVVLFGVNYFYNLTRLIEDYNSTDLGKRVLQNYFVLHAIMQYAGQLGGYQIPSDSEKKSTVNEIRWKMCLADTEKAFGLVLGAMYVEKHFNATQKEKAVSLVSDLINSFQNVLTDVNWIASNVTRARALKKLKSMVLQIGYPDNILNTTFIDDYYRSLMVSDNYASNLIASYAHSKEVQLKRLRTRPNSSEWEVIPTTTNVFYDVQRNRLVIPAGALTEPFYYAEKEIPAAITYGAIGSIIGHEITHGFDRTGRQYGRWGKLKNWWDTDTTREFTNLTNCFLKQYNAYQFVGEHLHGRRNLAENVADNGGLVISYNAFKNASIPRNNSLGNLNLSNEQMFFVGFAQVWCSIYTPQLMMMQILSDIHAPMAFRVLGSLSNSAEFAQAFQCPAGSRYNPTKKCNLW